MRLRTQLPLSSEPVHSSCLGEQMLEAFVKDFNSCGYFNDDYFDDRYSPKFEWFREALPQVKKIINLGCGRGRETFALMWFLKATEAIGIDNNHNKIKKANWITQFIIRNFSAEVMPSIFETCPEDRAKELQAWCEKNIPLEIREGRVPKFLEKDISEKNILQPYNHFDLVYCRYVLWKMTDKEGLFNAIENMANVVKPKVGRVVIVEPTEKDGVHYGDLEQHLRVTLTLVEVTDENHLGCLEWPGTRPKGYICLKS